MLANLNKEAVKFLRLYFKMMFVYMSESSLPGHLDPTQCLGGHLRVGGRHQAGHDSTDVGPSHCQHAIIFISTNI